MLINTPLYVIIDFAVMKGLKTRIGCTCRRGEPGGQDSQEPKSSEFAPMSSYLPNRYYNLPSMFRLPRRDF